MRTLPGRERLDAPLDGLGVGESDAVPPRPPRRALVDAIQKGLRSSARSRRADASPEDGAHERPPPSLIARRAERPHAGRVPRSRGSARAARRCSTRRPRRGDARVGFAFARSHVRIRRSARRRAARSAQIGARGAADQSRGDRGGAASSGDDSWPAVPVHQSASVNEEAPSETCDTTDASWRRPSPGKTRICAVPRAADPRREARHDPARLPPRCRPRPPSDPDRSRATRGARRPLERREGVGRRRRERRLGRQPIVDGEHGASTSWRRNDTSCRGCRARRRPSPAACM